MARNGRPVLSAFHVLVVVILQLVLVFFLIRAWTQHAGSGQSYWTQASRNRTSRYLELLWKHYSNQYIQFIASQVGS